MGNRYVIMTVEPSWRLSQILGFPYYIGRRFTLEELVSKGIVAPVDIERMNKGEQIHKEIPVGAPETEAEGNVLND